jgi:hypothetical protein
MEPMVSSDREERDGYLFYDGICLLFNDILILLLKIGFWTCHVDGLCASQILCGGVYVIFVLDDVLARLICLAERIAFRLRRREECNAHRDHYLKTVWS